MDDHGSRPSSTALARGALSRGSKRSDAAGGTSLHVTDSAASRAGVLRLRLACGEATLRTNGRGTTSTPTSAHPERSAADGGAESKGTPTPTPTPTATPTATPTPTPTATPSPTRGARSP